LDLWLRGSGQCLREGRTKVDVLGVFEREPEDPATLAPGLERQTWKVWGSGDCASLGLAWLG